MQIHTTIPAGHTGNTIYLLNFPAAHTPSRRYIVTPISAQEMRAILERADRPIVSALGHEGAAQAFAGLVGAEVPMSRLEVAFAPGDTAFCCKLLRRPPEGAILTREAMEQIGYQLVRVDVLLGDLELEIAERWVAIMRAMGLHAPDSAHGEPAGLVRARHLGDRDRAPPTLLRQLLTDARSNLEGWAEPNGYLVPSEPDLEERARIRISLRGLITGYMIALGEEPPRSQFEKDDLRDRLRIAEAAVADQEAAARG